MKKKITIKDILVLQIVIAIYTLSTVMAKQASGQPLLWSLIWAVVIFKDNITVKNVIGVALVIAGTIIVNGGRKEEDLTSEN